MSLATQPAQLPLTLVPASPAKTDTASPSVGKQPRERHITVTPRSLPRGDGYINVPQLILRGLYLEKIGLTIGSKVTVIEKPGELIVRLDGASAQRDPNETADDRRYARKVKRVTDYQDGTQLPLPKKIVAEFLSGKMPPHMRDLVSKLIDGEVQEAYQTSVHQFLTGKRNPKWDQREAESLLTQMDHLPVPKKKRAVKSKKSLANTRCAKPQALASETLPAPVVEAKSINPATVLRVAEPSEQEQPTTIDKSILEMERISQRMSDLTDFLRVTLPDY